MSWEQTAGGVGISGHKQKYTRGTLQGNWYEEREQQNKQPKAPFDTDSVSHIDYGRMQDKVEAAKQYQRADLGKGQSNEAGKCFVAARDASGQPLPCHATVNQLAYSGGKPGADQPGHVQQFLWTGKKHVDLGVPRSLPSGDGRAVDLTSTKAAQWAAESVPEPFTTTKNLASRPVVAALAHGDTAKRQTCRPSSEAGPAPISTKVKGDFAKSLDADWHHTGLRDSITAKGAVMHAAT